MNLKVDCLLELWGMEKSMKRTEAAISSPLGALADTGGLVMRSGSPGSRELAEVAMHQVLSRSALAVDRHLVRMFDEAPTGLGAGRAGSLYKLARARYMTTPRLLISEQCKLLGISKSTYQNWLDALHDHLAERLSEDLFCRDTWNELNRLSGIKAAS